MTSQFNQPQFQDEHKAREYLEALRWPNGPVCPHCGALEGHYRITGGTARDGLWKCPHCREQFTATVGTVFERSKIKLNIWFQAVYLIASSKKGMSSHQLHRTLGVTYKTAWFMTHRIREAMKSPGGLLGSKGGPVEADETYWNKKSRKALAKERTVIVFSLVERDGNVRSFHVPNVNAKTLGGILKAQIAKKAHLMTDEAPVYGKPGEAFKKHSTVNHKRGEYARGDVTTNSVEGYFSLLKRGLYGTYHHVSDHHLHRYTAEFDFRHNHRAKLGFDDTMRADEVLKGIGGKRLTYRRIDA